MHEYGTYDFCHSYKADILVFVLFSYPYPHPATAPSPVFLVWTSPLPSPGWCHHSEGSRYLHEPADKRQEIGGKEESREEGKRRAERREEKEGWVGEGREWREKEREEDRVCTACLHRREKHVGLVWYDGVGANLYLGIAKVEIDGLGMANVKDAIRLRREPCHHLHEEKSKVRQLPSLCSS